LSAAAPEAPASPRRQLIPRFSLARVRLLVGAVAPTGGSGGQPLPVTGIVSGPWMTPGNLHIDLQGSCNFGGVAVGNDPTSRILVTVTHLACVAPDGEVWEAGDSQDSRAGPLGYLAGRFDLSGKTADNYVGLDAKKVSDEGPLLLLRFLMQTAGDYAKAAAQAQVTSTNTAGALGGGSTTQNVTGDPNTYILGSALAGHAFPDLASFITQLLSEARPYFYVEAGREAYLVLDEDLDVTPVLHQYLSPGIADGTVNRTADSAVTTLGAP
ncbi:MAG TPA: hypothetical protein VL359_03275, partial [bacterium]|nr:hypothetical protein [bacterium]